jgi:hypothetical protein
MPANLRHTVVALAIAFGFAFAPLAAAEVYELRIYTANEGKLEALHDRFRNHTIALFEKHGMRNVAYWVDMDKPNTLVYVIAHQSRESATSSWQAFVADPVWQAAYAASIENGQLVANIENRFLAATEYSPMK